MRQPLDALRRLGRARPVAQERVVFAPAKTEFVPMDVDLRGQRAVEVESMLERYLDDAYRSGLPYVRIIHGKGTGALRQVVRDLLNASPLVARHELAQANQGGEGVTIAHMREQ
jgi:DNA mismatch repair protein MutS2